MRVLEVLSDTNRGGAGVYLENYATHASKEIELAVVLPEGAAMASRLRSAGAQVIECPLHGDRSYHREDVRLLRDLIRSFHPEIVHTHGSLSGRIAARQAGNCKTVYTKHTLSPRRSGLKGRAAALLDNYLTDSAIAVSEAACRNLREDGLPERKIHLIYNGITGVAPAAPGEREAARQALGLSESRIAIACVARLEAVKNHALLLEAFAGAAAWDPRLVLLLCGGGSLQESLVRQAKALPCTDRIVFLGERESVREIYLAADLFTLSSFSENLPLTVLEAMSASLPSVLTAVGGVPETAADRETALLVPSGDREALQQAILELSGSEELRRRLGEAARRRFLQHFTAQVFAEKTDSLYRKLVTGCE